MKAKDCLSELVYILEIGGAMLLLAYVLIKLFGGNREGNNILDAQER